MHQFMPFLPLTSGPTPLPVQYPGVILSLRLLLEGREEFPAAAGGNEESFQAHCGWGCCCALRFRKVCWNVELPLPHCRPRCFWCELCSPAGEAWCVKMPGRRCFAVAAFKLNSAHVCTT